MICRHIYFILKKNIFLENFYFVNCPWSGRLTSWVWGWGGVGAIAHTTILTMFVVATAHSMQQRQLRGILDSSVRLIILSRRATPYFIYSLVKTVQRQCFVSAVVLLHNYSSIYPPGPYYILHTLTAPPGILTNREFNYTIILFKYIIQFPLFNVQCNHRPVFW